MNILFYGDSLTSGENNNFVSYVDYFKSELVDKVDSLNIINKGISGTTFGDYSIYPVTNGDLLHRLMDTPLETISKADYIFLEYGLNDSTAIASRYTSIEHVLISLVKCEDFIRQLNLNCKICFIAFDGQFLERLIAGQTKYLKQDYLKCIPDTSITNSSILDAYTTISSVAYSVFDQVASIDVDIDDSYIDDDGLHPNDAGYRYIGEHLANVFQSEVMSTKD